MDDDIREELLDTEVRKWRYTMKGGADYLRLYLQKFDKREQAEDYNFRLSLAVCAAHAKKALVKIKNSMYQRFISIERSGISKSQVIVTKDNQTMNDFIGNDVLLELMSMQYVGVFVDRDRIMGATLASKANPPYLYIFKREDIVGIGKTNGEITAVKLRVTKATYDEFGIQTGTKTITRVLHKTPIGIKVYDDEVLVTTLDLPMVPFVLFDIKSSLLTDIADYQLAITNMTSTDIAFCMRGNFPIYTEQYDAASELMKMAQKQVDPNTGEVTDQQKTRQIGTMNGVSYPKDMERPGFISPKADCLKASMDKQAALIKEIDDLVNSTLIDLGSNEGGDSPESGLAYIAGVLEAGERQIAKIWAAYEGETLPDLHIAYPRNYSLKTDNDIRDEVKELREILPEIPSKGFQKALMKDIIKKMFAHKVSPNKLAAWYKEIDDLKVIKTDPKIIREDYEAGLVGTDTASLLLGYEIGEAEKAKTDHADRLARIAIAQSTATDRGVEDTNDPGYGKRDKRIDKELGKPQRGEGKDNGSDT